jgi:predicted nucleotidyltransferase
MPNVGTVGNKGFRSAGTVDALFTRTQQRVLALLFADPNRTFFQQELIELAQSGSGAVRRELDRLVDAGLVTVTRVGAQKRYQANRSAPIFDELRRIVVKTMGLADPLREALKPLKKRIRLALVYGSVARGEEKAGSDVDLLVVADDLPLERLYRRLEIAEKELGRRIDPTLYTISEYRKRRESGNPFLKKVLAGDTIVLMGDHELESR